MGGMEIGMVICGEETGEMENCTSGVGDRGGVLPRGESSESEFSSSDSLEDEAMISFSLGWVFRFFIGGDWATLVGFLFLGDGPFAPFATCLPLSVFFRLGGRLVSIVN